MTSHRALLLTLLQIPLISSLPHRPHEREHGSQRKHGVDREHKIVVSHGSKAAFRPQALAFEDFDVSSAVNSIFTPSTGMETVLSATVPMPTLDSFSVEPIFTTSSVPDPSSSDVEAFTSTTSYSTDSVDNFGFPTQPVQSFAPTLPASIPSPPTSSLLPVESSSVVVSSSEEPVFSPTSSFEESTVIASSTIEPTSVVIPTSTVKTSSLVVSTSSVETFSPVASVSIQQSSPVIVPTSIIETSSSITPTIPSSSSPISSESISFSTSEVPLPSTATSSTIREPSAFTNPAPFLPPQVNTTIALTSTVLSSRISSVVPTYSVSSYSVPVYSTSHAIPPWYYTDSSSTSCESTNTIVTVTTRTRRTRSRTIETTVTESEFPPSTSLIAPSQTFPTTSTIVISQTRTRTRVQTDTAESFPALQPSNSVPIVPPTLSFTATHSLVPSSTISLTLATTLTISEVQTLTSTTTVPPATTGVVHTSLNTEGQNTLQPFNTTVLPPPTRTVRPITKGPNQITFSRTMLPTASIADNIFVPIARGSPPPQIKPQANTFVVPEGVRQKKPIQTNKFYANFFSGSRTQGTWTHPYSVAWSAGGGVTGSWGLSVSYRPRSQLVYGPGSPPSYYVNAIGIQSLVLSARELGGSTDLYMDQLEAFSCNVNLSPSAGASPVLSFPLVQGMGFVTGIYNGGTPFIQSGVFFTQLQYMGMLGTSTARYLVTLTDNTNWLIYMTAERGSSLPTLTLAQSGEIVGSSQFIGIVQVARIPENTDVSNIQRIYDASAGVYPITGDVQASVAGSKGQYQLSWTKAGQVSKKLLMFALPHHVQSFSPSFKKSALKRSLQLDTTTKGRAIAVSADAWSLYHDDIPYDMGFAPWSPQLRSQTNMPASVIPLLQQVASYELAENFTSQTYLDSMYYSGKGLAKFAFTVYAANDLAKDGGVASAGLVKLKAAFAPFVNNQQIFPLLYDTTWGGVVSSCTYTTGDTGCDFGNSYYNDHHFHYGYFVYTAAVIGYLDPSWLKQGSNKAWVNTLVRDYANSVADSSFPFQRMFDWFHGHSWAHGLYETADGKDQESSSEDAFASYAIKMWGRTVGDPNMEARGNLMVAVQARSLQNYYLMKDNNQVEPPTYVPNKASGILFENKIDHTTYFGTNIEYIEGIHMIPLNPSSTLTRDQTFVAQEWNQYFANGYVDTIESGWRGILYANLAIFDPVTAYNFFAQSTFDMAWLDSGASRTWYLAWCAGLGGAS